MNAHAIPGRRLSNDLSADGDRDSSGPSDGASGRHLPVMLSEVLAGIEPREGGIYLDGTFGGGGYTRAILERAACTVWAIDRDPDAIARGHELASSIIQSKGIQSEGIQTKGSQGGGQDGLQLIEGGFGDMVALLAARGVEQLDGVVLDLGVSSFQIDDAGRGFSFRHDGPLDMRMSRHGESAADLVRTLGEAELADIIYRYGEERLSRRIARAIVAARAEQPIETTLQLATIIRSVMPPDRTGRIDPATRSFQALRIHVNDELGEIQRGLEAAAFLLAPGGRLVVVSFHSLEDRIVKRFMIEAAGLTPSPSRHDPRGLDFGRSARARFRLLHNKALRPGVSETHVNSRARSARLRALERLPDPPEMPSAGSLA